MNEWMNEFCSNQIEEKLLSIRSVWTCILSAFASLIRPTILIFWFSSSNDIKDEL